MQPGLAAAVIIGAILLFVVVANVARARAVSRREDTIVRARGVAHWSVYFFWVPYLVVALRTGPELALPDALRWLGLALAVGGVLYAIWALLVLGRHYDLELEIHRDHELVRRGPYRVTRHPIYTGLGLHFAGACLATGNLLLIAGTLAVSFPAFYVRAATEERLLRARFGAAYDDYARTTPMLVPFVRLG